MIHIKAIGIFNPIQFILIIICFFSFFGCKTIRQDIVKHNYITGELYVGDLFYNDSINVSIDFYGNTVYEDLSKIKKNKLKRELKDIKEVSLDNLIVSCHPENSKNYVTYYFFEKVDNASDTLIHERLVKDDTKNRIGIYEKQKGGKKIVCVTRSFTDSINALEKSKNSIKRVYIDSRMEKRMTYLNIFNYYTSYSNFLQAREKLRTAPIKDPKKSIWKEGFINTLNSFMSNNPEYNQMVKKHEMNKDHFDGLVEQALTSKEVKKNAEVFDAISDLAKNNQVIMLNEDHFYPKHRLFAMQLLEVLKQNGFTYLSMEAFTPNKEDNTSVVPNSRNGLYIREPYFGHFIRKANKMGFIVLGHENYDSNTDREIGQAKNIMKILENNPKAKIFVYVGHGHLEKEGKKRLMASYFKEYSKINPVTINQATIMTRKKDELVLIPKSVFANDTLMKSSADYFLINNIETDLTKIYPNKISKTIYLRDKGFKNYKNQDLLIEVYDWDEHYKNKGKGSLVSLTSLLLKAKRNKLELSLPTGKYYITVKSVDDERFKFDNFEVK
ncbi:hypothetical protein D3C85_741710 [compost metagenome]